MQALSIGVRDVRKRAENQRDLKPQ